MPKVARKRTRAPRYMPYRGALSTGAKLVAHAANNYVKYKNALVKGKNLAAAASNMIKRISLNRKAVRGTAYKAYDGGGFPQWSYKNVSMGKKQTFKQIVPRLLNATVNRYIMQFRGLRAFDNHGFYKSYQFGNLTGGLQHLPIYMFDITSRDTSLLSAFTVPLRRMIMDSAGVNDGKVRWASEQSLDAAGNTVGGNTWTVHQSPGNSVSPLTPSDKEFMAWTQIKMNCWGSKAKQTTFCIRLVQFTDEELDPFRYTGVDSVKHQVFWQSIVPTLCYNPQADWNNPHRRNMKVLKEIKFNLAPGSTTENDQDPNVKVLTIFNRWNRVLDYTQRGTVATDDLQLNGGDYTEVPTNMQQPEQRNTADYQIDSTKKIFLMITSTAYTPPHADFSNNTDASFDLVVRKQITTTR